MGISDHTKILRHFSETEELWVQRSDDRIIIFFVRIIWIMDNSDNSDNG